MRRRTEKRSPRYSGRGSGHDRYPEGPARKLGHQARLAGARRLPLVLRDIQGQDGDFPYGPHRAPEHSRRHGRGGRRGAVPRSSRPGPGAAAAGHYRGQKGGLPSRSGDDAAWGERASHLSRRHQAPLGSPAPGYRLDAITASPPRVTAEGPASVVRPLVLLRTMPIDVQGAKSNVNLEPRIDTEGKPIKLLDKSVSIQIKIKKAVR